MVRTNTEQTILTAVLLQLVIVLLIVRRSWRMSQGVPYSGARLVLVPVLLLALWGVTEAESTLLTPWAFPYLIGADAGVLAASGAWFAGVAQRATEFSHTPSGVWTYRIGFEVTAVFLGIYLVRLALAVALFPSSLVFGSMPGGYPPTLQQIVLAVIDAMLSLSVGLLLGRSVGIYRKRRSTLEHPA